MTEAVRRCAWISLFSVFFASGAAVGQEDPEITLLHWINMRGVPAIETLQEQWGQRLRKEHVPQSAPLQNWELDQDKIQRLVEDILELERRRVALVGTEIRLLDLQALRRELDRLADRVNHLMALYNVAIATHTTSETRRLKLELHGVIETAILSIDLATKHPTLLTRSFISPSRRLMVPHAVSVMMWGSLLLGTVYWMAHRTTDIEGIIGVLVAMSLPLLMIPLDKTVVRFLDHFFFLFSSDAQFRYFLSKLTLSGKTPVQRLREFLTIYFRLNQTHFESFWEPASSQASFTHHALDVLFAPCQR